jgi:hypothetical protein
VFVLKGELRRTGYAVSTLFYANVLSSVFVSPPAFVAFVAEFRIPCQLNSSSVFSRRR